jgi:hypothetical protein
MTENEAKTKWCPFARTIALMEGKSCGPANRITSVAPEPPSLAYDKCLGSQCMAWRWNHGPDDPEPNKVRIYIPDGYCGLADKP